MLKSIVGLLIYLASAVLHAETIDLGRHGSIEVRVSSGWKLARREIPDRGYNLVLTPMSGANAKCMVTLMYPPQPTAVDKEKMRGQLTAACQRFVDGSVERKIEIREYSLSAGYGVYCTFTDASLVGKPPQEGNYKVMNPGILQLSEDVIASVTVFSDDAAGAEQKEMIEMVSALNLKSKKSEG